MTRKRIYEYAEAVRRCFLTASKQERAMILDEFCQNSGYNRRSAIRLFRRRPKDPPAGRGRPRQFGWEVVSGLKAVWETADHICSKPLAPFLPELVAVLEREGELRVSPEVRAQLLRLSASSVDRLLKPFRQKGLRRPYTPRRPSTLNAQSRCVPSASGPTSRRARCRVTSPPTVARAWAVSTSIRWWTWTWSRA